MTDHTSDEMRRIEAEGAEFLAKQRAHVEELAAKEAARRAALGDDTLPEGTYATKEEAIAYLDAARAAGRFPQPIDDGTGNGDFTVEISSPYNGYQTVWITEVRDEDPNPPLNADMQPGS